jgi:hypothetical protein
MRSNVEPEKTGDGVGLTGNAETNQRQRSNVANELRAYPLARGRRSAFGKATARLIGRAILEQGN